MANNRKTTKGRRKQVVYSAPRKKLIETYLTPKGVRLLKDADEDKAFKVITDQQHKMLKKNIDLKYRKNRYTINTNAKPVKIINHAR